MRRDLEASVGTLERDVDRRSLPLYPAGSMEVPFVIAGADEEIVRDTLWEEHSHPTHELLWNDRGASTATIGTRTWTVTPRLGLWIPAGVPHSGWMPAGTSYRAVHFSFTATSPLAAEAVAVDITDLLRLLLDRLTADEIDEESRATTERMVLDVLTPTPHALLLRRPTSELLSPIVDAALADPSHATTLAEWAARLGVSSRTITRQFLAETGLGFSRWVASARTQHAITMLASGDSIDDVAALLGYASASAFGAAFRRVTGTSPGRFRSET